MIDDGVRSEEAGVLGDRLAEDPLGVWMDDEEGLLLAFDPFAVVADGVAWCLAGGGLDSAAFDPSVCLKNASATSTRAMNGAR